MDTNNETNNMVVTKEIDDENLTTTYINAFNELEAILIQMNDTSSQSRKMLADQLETIQTSLNDIGILSEGIRNNVNGVINNTIEANNYAEELKEQLDLKEKELKQLQIDIANEQTIVEQANEQEKNGLLTELEKKTAELQNLSAEVKSIQTKYKNMRLLIQEGTNRIGNLIGSLKKIAEEQQLNGNNTIEINKNLMNQINADLESLRQVMDAVNQKRKIERNDSAKKQTRQGDGVDNRKIGQDRMFFQEPNANTVTEFLKNIVPTSFSTSNSNMDEVPTNITIPTRHSNRIKTRTSFLTYGPNHTQETKGGKRSRTKKQKQSKSKNRKTKKDKKTKKLKNRKTINRKESLRKEKKRRYHKI